jgi:hypothetical protein
MIVGKASIQIGAVVAFFAWAAYQPLKAEDTATELRAFDLPGAS